MRFTIVTILVLCLAAVLGTTATARAANLTEEATRLCQDTIAALQQTAAAPLAQLLSTQASSFLAGTETSFVRTSHKKLAKAETWAEEPLLSGEAKLKDLEVTDRMYAGQVTAKIEDGDREFSLDGLCVYAGGTFRWLMVAVLPPEPQDGDQLASLKAEIAATMEEWRQTLMEGQVDQMLAAMAPDAFAVALVGPDYGFYVFSEPSEVQMMLAGGQIPGPLVVEVLGEPEERTTPLLASARYEWEFGVADFQQIPLEVWMHLYKGEDGWRVAGLCGLPPKQ